MTDIRFDDGAAYERMMGVWSRLAGDIFIDWLQPPQGLRWIDVGCGNGAFTELLVDRCAPSAIEGIDPSAAQLDYARTRPAARLAKFTHGDAMALPFPDDSFDAAVMALVLFFVPDPAKGVAEMVRVVKPGGMISAYLWDFPGGGVPLEPITVEMAAMNLPRSLPPSVDISGMDAMRALWTSAGLERVEAREISVQRSFESFDDFWTTTVMGTIIKPTILALAPSDLELLKSRVRKRLPTDAQGRISYGSRANAIKGRVPQ